MLTFPTGCIHAVGWYLLVMAGWKILVVRCESWESKQQQQL